MMFDVHDCSSSIYNQIYLYDFVSEISRQATAFFLLPLAWQSQRGRCISEPKWSLIYLHSFSQKGAWDGLVTLVVLFSLFWCLSPKKKLVTLVVLFWCQKNPKNIFGDFEEGR